MQDLLLKNCKIDYTIPIVKLSLLFSILKNCLITTNYKK